MLAVLAYLFALVGRGGAHRLGALPRLAGVSGSLRRPGPVSARPAGAPLIVRHWTMTTVQKFTLDPTESTQPIAMPAGARLLTVQLQGSDLALWAATDGQAASETRNFRVVETSGASVDFRDVFLGTVQLGGGGEVHVFEYFPE